MEIIKALLDLNNREKVCKTELNCSQHPITPWWLLSNVN